MRKIVKEIDRENRERNIRIDISSEVLDALHNDNPAKAGVMKVTIVDNRNIIKF